MYVSHKLPLNAEAIQGFVFCAESHSTSSSLMSRSCYSVLTFDFLEPAKSQTEHSSCVSLASRLGFSFQTPQPISACKNTCCRITLRTRFILEIRKREKKYSWLVLFLKKKKNTPTRYYQLVCSTIFFFLIKKVILRTGRHVIM